jgi:hypothetical protein
MYSLKAILKLTKVINRLPQPTYICAIILKQIDMTLLANLEKDFTSNVMGYSAMGIILSTCLGSIAIMQTLSFGNGFFQMLIVLLCVMICSAHNAAILTVQNPKLIFKLLGASVLLNGIIIITSIIL